MWPILFLNAIFALLEAQAVGAQWHDHHTINVLGLILGTLMTFFFINNCVELHRMIRRKI